MQTHNPSSPVPNLPSRPKLEPTPPSPPVTHDLSGYEENHFYLPAIPTTSTIWFNRSWLSLRPVRLRSRSSRQWRSGTWPWTSQKMGSKSPETARLSRWFSFYRRPISNSRSTASPQFSTSRYGTRTKRSLLRRDRSSHWFDRSRRGHLVVGRNLQVLLLLLEQSPESVDYRSWRLGLHS